jgi:pilus assembly protein CpaC
MWRSCTSRTNCVDGGVGPPPGNGGGWFTAIAIWSVILAFAFSASASAQSAFDGNDPHGVGILLKPHTREKATAASPAPKDADDVQATIEIPLTSRVIESEKRENPPQAVPVRAVKSVPDLDFLSSGQPREPNNTLPMPKPSAAPFLTDQTISGFPLALQPVPQRGPQTRADVASFVENLGTNDASFEIVIGQGRLLTLKENLAMAGKAKPVIAVGDPSIVDFVVVGPRQIRLVGQKVGATDLSITTGDGKTFSFEIEVVADLSVLRVQLRAMFPNASLKLTQVRDSVVVEGEAHDTGEVARIIEAVKAYMLSVQLSQGRKISGQSAGRTPGNGQQAPPWAMPGAAGAGAGPPGAPGGNGGQAPPPGANAFAEPSQLSISGTVGAPQVINLIRVPGSQQVLLKVRVAELNRTSLREIGADWLAVDPSTGNIVGTQIGGAGVGATSTLAQSTGLTASATATLGSTNTVFGIFQKGDFEFFLTALRQNLILKVLAEPNLVAMNGQQASFLAGGEFPVPVPQVGTSGAASTVTVQFKEFGVRLGFTPFILDGDVVRLTVDPEVSSIDNTIATTLVAGGSPVPGVATRKAHTTVELKDGQTLMIAGLMQLTLEGQTSRIPGLGDLPIIGPFFSNTSSKRQEKELVVMVTPYLIEPMNCDQVPPYPGAEVNQPTDLELYFLARIEGRTGRDFRATTEYDDPWHLLHHVNLEKKYISGPCGFSE